MFNKKKYNHSDFIGTYVTDIHSYNMPNELYFNEIQQQQLVEQNVHF